MPTHGFGRTAISVAAGAFVGLAAATGFGFFHGDRARAADDTSATVHADNAAPEREGTGAGVSKRKLAGLERRLAELELRAGAEQDQAAAAGEAEDADREAAAAPARPPIPYETVVAQWQGRLATHAAESRSPAFADRWGTALEADLVTLRSELPAGMVVSAIDCRSSSCAVSVEWPSFAAAAQDHSALSDQTYQTNCWRELLLPRPEQGREAEPYRSTMLFTNCRE